MLGNKWVPKQSVKWDTIAWGYAKSYQFDLAYETIESKLQDKNNQLIRLEIQGYITLIQGNYDKSIEYYLRATDINPYSDTNLFNLTIAYEKTRQIEEAIISIEKAISVNPKSEYILKKDTLLNLDSSVESP